MWAPRRVDDADTVLMGERLAALVFSRDGVVPFDASCPFLSETKLDASGHLYDRSGVIEAHDGSVKKDGSMGAGVSWSSGPGKILQH